jgi:hypothetical protein
MKLKKRLMPPTLTGVLALHRLSAVQQRLPPLIDTYTRNEL